MARQTPTATRRWPERPSPSSKTGTARSSLRTDHNTFVVAENNGRARADRTAIGAWEKFTVERQPDGQFAFRTFHGTYLVAEEDGRLNANRTQVGPWEKFQARSATNGRTATLVEYGRDGTRIGRFYQIDDTTWVEENPGSRVTFEELQRDDWLGLPA